MYDFYGSYLKVIDRLDDADVKNCQIIQFIIHRNYELRFDMYSSQLYDQQRKTMAAFSNYKPLDTSIVISSDNKLICSIVSIINLSRELHMNSRHDRCLNNDHVAIILCVEEVIESLLCVFKTKLDPYDESDEEWYGD